VAAPLHELAITQGIVETISQRCDGARVIRVRLSIGKLSGVVPDSVRFCFDLVADGTPVAGARLDIEEPEGWARCRSCSQERRIDDLVLLCPCGSADLDVLRGESLAIRSVEVI
jgi:hydrogenase nickel incorporation protein HypA/HybF